jgi:tetratricopeptide (TPR) repeat protein
LQGFPVVVDRASAQAYDGRDSMREDRMLRTDLLLADFETAGSVWQWKDGELLRMAGESPSPILVYVPEDAERGRRELEMTSLLKTPGVPTCRQFADSGAGVKSIVLEDVGDARPLALVHDLPASALRAGLVALLATLRFVHSRGIVHGRIDRSVVLVDTTGRFSLFGWADARPVSSGRPAERKLGEVSVDLRDLARAFREALLRRPWPDPAGAKIHERDARTPAGQDLIDAGVKVDRDFARVLSRLVAVDPREAYTGATDVLADVGAVEITAFDPWESVPAIGIRRDIVRVLRFLEATRLPEAANVRHAASVEFVAPDGAGKSRLLAELARVARARDVIVLTAEGGARGPWGGVGAIARHLVQLLGRRARVCVQHDEALRQLFGGVDGEPRVEGPTHEAPGVDGRESLVSLCTAAVTDLVKAAFRRTPGLLLLDDEEHLSTAARRVWRSTGQFVQEINGSGDALRALLVSTSCRTYPAEIGAERVVVEMRPWRPRDLEHFLSLAFATPGGARDAGEAVHRITGGRPGEVVGYLRELERRGLLHREGLRWSPAAPLSALPPFSGGVADQVARSLEAAGRDAVSLVESLAVARDVMLRRDTVGELCGLRGPRLAAAASAAVGAGLLVADGASWRVRTEAVRHKVYAAIADDRRRVLHREVLTHLLDAAPDAADSIAAHARAGADPRAEAWTRDAVQRARDVGEWEIALRHLEEAATMVGRSFAGADVDLERGELLTCAGRLGEAMDVFESLLERLAPGDALLSTVRLSTARAFYEAREWERILEIDLPESPESNARGEQLAELRYIRAAALQHLNRTVEARRESRLAAAELEGEEPVAVQLARLECDYQGRFYALDIEGVRHALLTKLRVEARLNHRLRFVADLIKLANAHRVMGWRRAEAHAILVRAVRLCRNTAGISGMTNVALRSNLGLMIVDSVRHRRRLLASAHQVALQSGLGPYVSATRIRLIAANGLAATCDYSDKQYISSYCQNLDRLSPTQMSATATELANCLVYFAFQQELERLRERCNREDLNCASARHVRASCILGRILFDDDIDALIPAMDDGTPRDATLKYTTLEEFLSKDYSYALIARFAMQGALDRPNWPADWDVQRLIAMANGTPEPGWGATFLALCIALWMPVSLDAEQWDELNAMVRSRPTPMPVGLEWQRLLLESRRLRKRGEWRAAERVKHQAERQLALLLRPEHGAPGRAAYERWRARLDARTVRVPPVSTSFATLTVAVESPPAELDVMSFCPEWASAAADVGAVAALVVTSPHRRELELFGERAIADGNPARRRWRAAEPIDEAKLPAGCRIVLEFPNFWTKEQIGRATSRLSSDRDETTRIVSLLTVPMSEFRERGPEERALAEFIDGKLVKLPPLCAVNERRSALFGMVVRAFAPGAQIDEDAVGDIVGYVWPGGFGEMETVARAALEIDRARVSRRALLESGWRERLVDVDDGMSETERAILGVVRTTVSAVGIADIAAGSGRPVRTVLRHLESLMRDGRVARSGRGRATRYRLPHAGGACRA